MSKTPSKLDAIERTYFNSLFVSLAEEMGVALRRTAYSPNIKERRDYSCAIFSGRGELVAQAAHIPVHLGALPISMEAVRSAYSQFAHGDVIMLNDPYQGGTHLPDITLVSPVILPGQKQPFAFMITRAHHADVGGLSPGSLPMSQSIYQEGLRFPPVKLYDAGVANDDLLRVLYANVRTPRERAGDLRAQVAAHRVGELRVKEAVEKYGRKFLDGAMREIIGYGEDTMRALIKRIPDGIYTFADVLDGDGLDSGPLKIAVHLRIKGSGATADFTGSSPACRGSLNAVEAITRSAVYYAFLCLLQTPSRLLPLVVHDPPVNQGCLNPIEVKAPAGSIVNAEPPHAVAGGNVETSQRIVDVVLGALARALPIIVPAASQGTMNNLTFGGIRKADGNPFVYYETLAGGMGGRPQAAGLSGVQAHMTNTLNTPVEALEYDYPVRVLHYGLIPGSGGLGKHRGGDGVRRDIEFLEEAEVTLLTDRREHAPYGLQGGKPGRKGKNILTRDGTDEELPGKCSLQVAPDDVLSIRTPGGGGWGRKRS